MLIRQITDQDIDDVISIELKIWGEEMAAMHDKWRARISTFPEGCLAAFVKNKMVGTVALMKLNYYVYEQNYYPSWDEITSNGYISNHAKNGKIFYGVNIGVMPDNIGIARHLFLNLVHLGKLNGVKTLYIGCRIPSLAKKLELSKIENPTMEQVEKFAKTDPEVIYFTKYLHLEYVDISKDYFEVDRESLGYGVILKYEI